MSHTLMYPHTCTCTHTHAHAHTAPYSTTLTFLVRFISLHLAKAGESIVELIKKCVKYCTQEVLRGKTV